jgi:hypothetical protein
MTTILFSICNSGILLVWGILLFLPRWKGAELLIQFPWIPFVLSFFYLYFIVLSGGLNDSDFTTLTGIQKAFQNASLESTAAGWLHYLAFDFWVGTWIIRHSRKHKISHIKIFLPLLATFLLGPVGILFYTILYWSNRIITKAN